MAIDLTQGARPDERFHLQEAEPTCEATGYDWLYRVVQWKNLTLPDGQSAEFTTHILLWFFRWYTGSAKCDGGRTINMWRGVYGKNPPHQYVITTTPKEMFSVRVRWRTPDREVWSNMGGI